MSAERQDIERQMRELPALTRAKVELCAESFRSTANAFGAESRLALLIVAFEILEEQPFSQKAKP